MDQRREYYSETSEDNSSSDSNSTLSSGFSTSPVDSIYKKISFPLIVITCQNDYQHIFLYSYLHQKISCN
jgi:hypothetical protein